MYKEWNEMALKVLLKSKPKNLTNHLSNNNKNQNTTSRNAVGWENSEVPKVTLKLFYSTFL